MNREHIYFGGLILVVLLVISNMFRVERISSQTIMTDTVVTVIDEQPVLEKELVHIPSSFTFCGEKVPLDKQSVKESLDFELIVNKYRHSRTMLILKKLHRWRVEIDKVLEEEGVPQDIFYVAVAESELRNDARSHVGAMGMWQFMERTGKEYGLKKNRYIDQRRDPELATRAACKYFKRAYDRFGNWTLAAASYNMGMSGLSKRLESQKVDSYYDLYLNRETGRYVYRILAFKQILENPNEYGFDLTEDELYPPLVYEEIIVDSSIDDLIEFASEYETNYKELRRLNPWLNNSSDYRLVVSKGEVLKIKVPISILEEKDIKKEIATL